MSATECCADDVGGDRAATEPCCGVEAVVSVDERGQMVLPKEVREKLGLKAGDKLAVVTMQQEGDVCCVTLIKTDRLSGMVQTFLGPIADEIARG